MKNALCSDVNCSTLKIEVSAFGYYPSSNNNNNNNDNNNNNNNNNILYSEG